jgi:plastocyanin
MSSRFRSPAVCGLVLCGLAAPFVGSCGMGSSSPVANSPVPTAVAPSPAPTPTPTPTPTPAPTPAPAPNPYPTPPSEPAPTPTPVPSSVTITINGIDGGMSFSPASATVKAGQAIRWRNADSIAHTATQDSSGFDTGLIPPGGTSAPITLSTPGTIGYHCAVHTGMVGTLSVTP